MDQIELLMHASLPPSPTSSPTHLRLGGNTTSNLRMHQHRGGSTSSPIQPENFSSQTMEQSLEQHQQQQGNQIVDDKITSSSSSSMQLSKEEMPTTPERTLHSKTSFSSPYSDESTPTKVLDVARKNC